MTQESLTVNAPPTLALLRAQRQAIMDLVIRYGGLDVRVFGSVARGEAQTHSDVDLLVRFGEHSLLDRIALQHALMALLGYSVQVVQEHTLKHEVRGQVLQEAVWL